MGFIVALTPLSIALVGWRGAAGSGTATGCASIWFGGLLLILAGLLEFVLEKNFPFVAFMGYGAHFLTYGATFVPSVDAVAAFTTYGSETLTPPFLASVGESRAFHSPEGFPPLILHHRSLLRPRNGNSLPRLPRMLGAHQRDFLLDLCLCHSRLWLGNRRFLATGSRQCVDGTTLLVGTGGSFFAAARFGWYIFVSVPVLENHITVLTSIPFVISASPRDLAWAVWMLDLSRGRGD